MKHSQLDKYSFIVIGICFLVIVSCRKKDEKYEGNYIGTETHTVLDSGATSYSLDTTYLEEFQITYSRLPNSRRKFYSFDKVYNNSNSEIFSLHRKDIVNHEISSAHVWDDAEGNYGGGSSFLKFVGDSMYYQISVGENGTDEVFDFKGKRN